MRRSWKAVDTTIGFLTQNLVLRAEGPVKCFPLSLHATECPPLFPLFLFPTSIFHEGSTLLNRACAPSPNNSTIMLNYNDNTETLQLFYKTDNLDSPVKDNGSALAEAFQDPQLVGEMPAVERLDALNEYLVSLNPLQDHLAAQTRDPLSGEDLVGKLVKAGAVSSATDPLLNKFLVSSREFDSQAYLSVVHQNTPIEKLISSLNGLDGSIRSQTHELKAVLDENFEDFLLCKKAIDESLGMFRELKSKAQKDSEKSKVFLPAAKRNKKRLDATETLLSELEEAINNINLSTSLLIRPVMDHNEKEAKIAKLIEFVNSNLFLFNLPQKLVAYLTSHDYTAFIDDYNRFTKEKKLLEDKQQREILKARQAEDSKLVRSLQQLHNIQNTALSRVYKEVAEIAEEYRRKCLQDLLSMDHEVSDKNTRKLALDVKFIDLVEKLHRMTNSSSTSTPIRDFLQSQLDKLESELEEQHAKFVSRFSSMQTKLSDYINSLAEQRQNGSYVNYIAEKFNSVEEFFRASTSYTTLEIGPEKEAIIIEIFGNSENLDLSIINETWLVLSTFVKYVEEFFNGAVLKFVKNYAHYSSPETNFDVDPNGELRQSFFNVMHAFIEKMLSIFDSDSPTDQMKVTPANYSAFLPYHTNSLSAVFYLSAISKSFGRTLSLFGNYATQVGNTNKSFDTNKQIKSLREISVQFDQRILEAICATWANDCSQFFDFENWERYNDFDDRKMKGVIYTKLMQIIYYYELYILEKLSSLLIRKSSNGADVRILSPYPSKRILVSVEIQFMRSLNVIMNSSFKKFAAEKDNSAKEQASIYEAEHSTYKILTMNNFSALGDFVYPKLIQKFDELFEKTLSKQNLKLFADLDKVKLTILDEINDVEKLRIEAKVDKHFANVKSSGMTLSLEIDPFVYDCLLHFVKLVSVFKPLTDTTTFIAIMQQLQTQFLNRFLLCLRVVSENEQIISSILGNIKLDLDFFVEVFEASETLKLDDYCLNLVQIILGQVQKVEAMFSDLGFTQKEIDQKLYKALEHSENEFTCFV